MIRRLSTSRFVIFGVVIALAIGYAIFIVASLLYPLTLSPSDVSSLIHHGKSVAAESATFGYTPALWVSVGIIAYVIDSAAIRRQANHDQ